MPRLNDLQDAFGAFVFDDDIRATEHIIEDGIAAADRLRIYRNTAFGALTDALRLTYPAVERLVGTEFFDAAAHAFIRRHPPSSAYLGAYGVAFADFLAEFPPAGSVAYLPDVARFEWVLNVAANAPDTPALDPATLAAIDAAEHGRIRFLPHPSFRILALRYPADAIADAVLAREDRAMAALDPSSGPIWLAIHRGPDGVEAERMQQAEWRLTERIYAGIPLGPALATFPVADAAALLAGHLTKGRFAGFELIRQQMEHAS